MPKTIAVFGAGSGLGASVALRFGREGHRVALVARREEPLKALAERLAAEGVEATIFTGDLAQTDEIPGLVAAITERLGPIDTVYYAPIAGAGFTPAAELTAELVQGFLDLLLLTPIKLVGEVLPGMLERGEGSILLGAGASAVTPAPFMSGVGPAMAAARNYAHSLHGEVADKGVYVGTLFVNAMITGSAAHDALTSGELALELPEGVELPTVDPADLADLLWQLQAERDRVEVVHPEVGAL